MGMFNEVVIPCPQCGFENSVQSKAGSCELAYQIYPDVEPADLIDADGAIFECGDDDCECTYQLSVQVVAFPIII